MDSHRKKEGEEEEERDHFLTYSSPIIGVTQAAVAFLCGTD
jgi:hypothetical protein